MNTKMRKKANLHTWLLVLLLIFSTPFTSLAQATTDQGGDFFSQIGKIYVVVAVIVIIFLGLAFYLFKLDKKISELEKQIKK